MKLKFGNIFFIKDHNFGDGKGLSTKRVIILNEPSEKYPKIHYLITTSQTQYFEDFIGCQKTIKEKYGFKIRENYFNKFPKSTVVQFHKIYKISSEEARRMIKSRQMNFFSYEPSSKIKPILKCIVECDDLEIEDIEFIQDILSGL